MVQIYKVDNHDVFQPTSVFAGHSVKSQPKQGSVVMVTVSYGSLPEGPAPLRKRGTAALLVAGLALCAAAACIGFAVVTQVLKPWMNPRAHVSGLLEGRVAGPGAQLHAHVASEWNLGAASVLVHSATGLQSCRAWGRQPGTRQPLPFCEAALLLRSVWQSNRRVAR